MTKFQKWIIVVLILSLASFVFLSRNINKESNPDVISSLTKPLAFFTTVDTPKGTIYLFINQDEINFNPVETPYYPKAPTIKKEKYPKLFKQGIANFSALRAEYYKESKDGETYIKLSNIQPDHGGYADTYAILVNPFTGTIKESRSIDDGVASF